MAERVRPQNRPRSGHDPTICRTRPGFRPAQPFGRQAVTADWSGRSGRKRRDHRSGRLRESWGLHLATKPIVSKPVGHDHKATIGPSQPLLETGSNLDVKKQSQPQQQQQPSPGSPGWQPSVALQAGNPQDLVTQNLSHVANSLNGAPTTKMSSNTAQQFRRFGAPAALVKLASAYPPGSPEDEDYQRRYADTRRSYRAAKTPTERTSHPEDQAGHWSNFSVGGSPTWIADKPQAGAQAPGAGMVITAGQP